MACPSPPQHTLSSLRAGAASARRHQHGGHRGRVPASTLRVPGAAALVSSRFDLNTMMATKFNRIVLGKFVATDYLQGVLVEREVCKMIDYFI